MFSIICVYNDKKILDEWLLKSLSNQTENFELILLDNVQQKYRSAAEALNIGGKLAKNEYLLFVHQDLCFCSSDFLEKVEYFIESLPNFGVLGLAGLSKHHNYRMISKMAQGLPVEKVGMSDFNWPIEVQTVDECCFIILKDTLKNFLFDEITVTGWHLYCVDYCLTMIKNKKYNYVLPLPAYHRSNGRPLPKNYFPELKKILRKYHSDFDYIYTTCGIWNVHIPVILQRTYGQILTIFLFVGKNIKRYSNKHLM